MFMAATGDRIRFMRGRGITTNPRRFMLDRCTARTDITDHTATIACIASGMNGITAGGIDKRIERFTPEEATRKRARGLSLAPFVLEGEEKSTGDERKIVGEDGAETAHFVLIVQQYDGNNAQLLFAGVARRYFALQVL